MENKSESLNNSANVSKPNVRRQSIKLLGLKEKTKFKDWNTGQNYKLEKVLGKGSYGEVAQAI